MIFDCFLYSGEDRMLDIRINTIRALNVTHISIESSHTFSGHRREMMLRKMTPKFPSLIAFEHESSLFVDAWANEIRQRNEINNALRIFGPKDDDVIIISDIDEIPRYETIQSYKPEMGFCALRMDYYAYYLNRCQEKQSWNHARIMPYSYLKDKTADAVRNSGFPRALENAGWHFSYCGGVEAIINKVASFSHQELNTPESNNERAWKERMQFGHTVPMEELPVYIRMNQEKFKDMLYVECK